jgi:capsular polysaccharide biosynthesis protein
MFYAVIIILEFLIDNIFVEFGAYAFQQTIVIHMSTNWAHFLANFFTYFYEAESIQILIKDKLITAG